MHHGVSGVFERSFRRYWNALDRSILADKVQISINKKSGEPANRLLRVVSRCKQENRSEQEEQSNKCMHRHPSFKKPAC